MQINIYTDGGCSGNPGPGGWAFVLLSGNSVTVEKNGGDPNTTNNRMELTAVIRALETLPSITRASNNGDNDGNGNGDNGGGPTDGVTVFTDSQYVQKGISEWIAGWKRKGWITSTKQPVKNVDLWQQLDALAATVAAAYPLKWKWVRGHAGNPLNERCDALVQEAIHAIQAGKTA
ncbi:MAG: ribonuclease HI [Spirochaetaceae bacterium]|jgi:ribonuclease HI|nr:ribonuclease HI [Spirochaetaceae bacterium]